MKKTHSLTSSPVRAAKTAFFSVAVLSIVSNILMLAGPVYMLQIYDRVLTSRSVPTLVALTALVAGLYILMGILESLRSFMLVRISDSFDKGVSEEVYQRTVSRSQGKDAVSGQDPMMNLEKVRKFLSGTGPIALMDMPWTPAFLFLVYLLHPSLGLLSTLGAVFVVVLVIGNDLLSRSKAGDIARARHLRDGYFDRGYRNQEALIAMGMTSRLSALWSEANARYLDLHKGAMDKLSVFRSTIKISRLFMQSALLGLGAYLVIHQEITAGVMIAASIITARALAPVEQAVAQWNGFIEAQAGYRQLRSLLKERGIKPPSVSIPLPTKRLDVKNMSIASPNGTQPIVRDITFHLEAGDGLGIIGPSGGGKSTLIRGLLGVWPRVAGTVQLDGSSPEQWDQRRLGSAIGYLPQSVHLLDGTIAENISRFAEGDTSDKIIAAANSASAHEMIVSLPQGYDTLIGSGGVTLSGGQVQRIGLARALYDQPFLIILDEPNANLDKIGEQALLRSIETLRKQGSIVIIVSHRLSGVSVVDKLMIVERGQITGYGDKEKILPHIGAKSATPPANSYQTQLKIKQ